ncbi:MAG TPA: carbon-nitrogen hydrolase family protein [Negativicutes bacterium]|nr:carbon-nitrogen hydrolase family protein [Negativicutes bacterium]
MKRTTLRSLTALCIAGIIVFAFTLTALAAPAYENNLKMAVVNFQPVWGDKDANLKKMVSDTVEAANSGAKLIVFPEMALTGYAMEQGKIDRADRMQVKLAEKFDGPSAQAIAKVAKEKGVYVVYGYPEVIGDDPLNVYNSALAVGPDGIIGSYQKIHPFGSEVIWCKTGTTPFTFDTPWGPIGISICYDTYNYPELSRYYGALGCRLILNPTATSRAYYVAAEAVNGKPLNDGKPINGNNAQWVNRFKSRIEATVIQSDLFVATADLVGAEKAKDGKFMGTCFPGGSCVIGPIDDKKGTPSFIGYYGTDPATATDVQIIYSQIDLAKATRNSFENYIKTDLQEGYLYSPALYVQWYSNLVKGKYAEK